ncbi:unnamed protein product, partial [Urochloa humidicola]
GAFHCRSLSSASSFRALSTAAGPTEGRDLPGGSLVCWQGMLRLHLILSRQDLW